MITNCQVEQRPALAKQTTEQRVEGFSPLAEIEGAKRRGPQLEGGFLK